MDFHLPLIHYAPASIETRLSFTTSFLDPQNLHPLEANQEPSRAEIFHPRVRPSPLVRLSNTLSNSSGPGGR
jgi:hypothetical protein